jgi:hypothetical protein
MASLDRELLDVELIRDEVLASMESRYGSSTEFSKSGSTEFSSK